MTVGTAPATRHAMKEPHGLSEHHHFMCTACKHVIEFDTDLIEAIKFRFEGETGACVATGAIVLYGLCETGSRGVSAQL